jgi:XRE family transcriptional regulator, regulator of sulfur utilization
MPRFVFTRVLVPVCGVALLVATMGAQSPLRSTVFPADSARARNGPANQRSLVDTLTAILTKLEMHETTLAPGQSPHPPHRHAHEELMVVRTGVVEVLQGTKTRLAHAGDVIFMASNELHGLKNTSSANTTYLVIRIDPHDLPADAKPSTAPQVDAGRTPPTQ